MTDTPPARLNAAAALLGLPDGIAPDCGQMQWSDLQSKIILALATRTVSLAECAAALAARQVAPAGTREATAAQAVTAATRRPRGKPRGRA